MSGQLQIQFTLSKELWRRFFEAHFAADKALNARYLWGVVCLVIGSLGLGGFYQSSLIASLLMATGLYGILSRQILVIKSMRKARRHPFYGQCLDLELSTDEIAVRSGDSGYNQPWSNFSGYRSVKPGFMFYLDTNAFFFIPRTVLNAEQEAELQQILGTVKLRKY